MGVRALIFGIICAVSLLVLCLGFPATGWPYYGPGWWLFLGAHTTVVSVTWVLLRRGGK